MPGRGDLGAAISHAPQTGQPHELELEQPEWARLYRGPGRYQPELLHARFVRHRFARHAHDEYVIACTESGVQAFRCLRARKVAPPGHVFVIHPGDAHVDETTQDAYVYRAFYPCVELVAQVAADVWGRSATGLPTFRGEVVHDSDVARALSRLHASLASQATQLTQDTCMVDLLALLLVRYGEAAPAAARIKPEHRAVRLARERLDAEYARPLSLHELAATGGLSPYHFERVFAAEVGLPAHAYQEVRRIARARQLLGEGMALASVACELGYPDQAHFTRRFKRFVGVTPGAYARSMRRPSGSV